MHRDKADKILYDVLGAELEESDIIDAKIDEAYKIIRAREIPILGTIFAKVADVFPFGNLPEEESSVLYEEEDSLYQVKDGGITVTLEQEYVSNQALFIGVRIESEEPIPELVAYVENGILKRPSCSRTKLRE